MTCSAHIGPYEVKAGPYEDQWHMPYWVCMDDEGNEILVWESGAEVLVSS